MHVINSIEPEHVAATATADARLVWIGKDDRGIELEIVLGPDMPDDEELRDGQDA